MDMNNKYTGFEKMLKEKLDSFEYSYSNSDWYNFEKDLPGRKWYSFLQNNIFKNIIIGTSFIVPIATILYFTLVSNTENSKNIHVKKYNQESTQNINKNNPEEKSNIVSVPNKSTSENFGNTISSLDKNNSSANKETSSNNINSENNNTNTPFYPQQIKTVNTEKDFTSNKESKVDETKNNITLPSGELFKSNVIEGCVPLTVNFTPAFTSENISYSWSFGDGKTSSKISPTHTFIKTGNYTVTLTVSLINDKSKKTEYSNYITVNSIPNADFEYSFNSESEIYCFTDNSSDVFSWYWNFGDNIISNEKSPTHLYNHDGAFNVQLVTMNSNGCRDSISKVIDVKLKELYYCPTGFTPNSDGMNDYFGPIGEKMNPNGYKMLIFDQKGTLVFESTDLNILWDGKKIGTNYEAPQGLYVWKITMKDKNNVLKESTGFLTLLK